MPWEPWFRAYDVFDTPIVAIDVALKGEATMVAPVALLEALDLIEDCDEGLDQNTAGAAAD